MDAAGDAAVDFAALAGDLPAQADRELLLDTVTELHGRRCVHTAVPPGHGALA